MKKTLSQNISRYDSKTVLKINGQTIRALLIALVTALLCYVLGSLIISGFDSLLVACVIFLGLAVLQLGELGGVPLIKIVGMQIAYALGRRDIRLYEHIEGDPAERLIIIERSAENAERKKENTQDR